jgi:hypothetical protein
MRLNLKDGMKMRDEKARRDMSCSIRGLWVNTNQLLSTNLR